jgi:hypothetical protein
MRLVVIESPYAEFRTVAGKLRTVQDNIAYAKACMLDSLRRGEAPYASHLLLTQVLDDLDLDQREQGIQAGLAWAHRADLRAVYQDYGTTPGMHRGIISARSLGQSITYRTIL